MLSEGGRGPLLGGGTSPVCVMVVVVWAVESSKSVFQRSWRTVWIHVFGLICGWC